MTSEMKRLQRLQEENGKGRRRSWSTPSLGKGMLQDVIR
jgi:hypothetical protein